MLGRACFNGASEMVTNLSMAVTTFLFNAIMMAYLGEAGVSAITIVLYAQFLLVALYMGFSMGVAPVFSFNRGAGRYDRMRRIFGYCLRFILVSSVAILAVALALCEKLLGGRGACRVHGGGFAGTIQAFVPLEILPAFQEEMERVLGSGSCHVLTIRPVGGARLV